MCAFEAWLGFFFPHHVISPDGPLKKGMVKEFSVAMEGYEDIMVVRRVNADLQWLCRR